MRNIKYFVIKEKKPNFYITNTIKFFFLFVKKNLKKFLKKINNKAKI